MSYNPPFDKIDFSEGRTIGCSVEHKPVLGYRIAAAFDCSIKLSDWCQKLPDAMLAARKEVARLSSLEDKASKWGDHCFGCGMLKSQCECWDSVNGD